MPTPEIPNHFTKVTRQLEYGKPTRELVCPDDEARSQHEAMLGFLYNRRLVNSDGLRPETFVASGMPGSQILDNVLPHKDNWTFYMLDIKSAFSSVDITELKEKVIMAAETSDAVDILDFIDAYGTTPLVPGLPQGAPCSPYLFNFYMQDTDRALDAFCRENRLAYTRWLDDITISSPKKEKTLGEDTRSEIRQIVEQTPGMKVNHAKGRKHSRASRPITITGVSIYPDDRIQPKPAIIKKAFDTFDVVENDIFGMADITDSHVGLLDGYHGALVSMSQEPLSPIVENAIKRYRQVRRLASAAIEMQNEPPFTPDPEIISLIRALIKNIGTQAYRKRIGEPYIENGERFVPS